MLSYVMLATVSGMPVVTVPIAFPGGVPVGVQLIGRWESAVPRCAVLCVRAYALRCVSKSGGRVGVRVKKRCLRQCASV
jgi:hypothetical protein